MLEVPVLFFGLLVKPIRLVCAGRSLKRQSGTRLKPRPPSITAGMPRLVGRMRVLLQLGGTLPLVATSGMQPRVPAAGMPLQPLGGWELSQHPKRIDGMRLQHLAG